MGLFATRVFQVALGLLPSFAWLFFYLEGEDDHKEPARLVLVTFIMGAIFALLALIVQVAFVCSYSVFTGFPCSQLTSDPNLAVTLPFLLLFPFIEELAKFFGAYVSVRKKTAFNHPIDAMIYTTIAALGFAAVENIAVATEPYPSPFLGSIFKVLSLRFIGATLLHTLTSALVGYYWALSIRDFGDKKPLYTGLLIATCLHAAFNYLILTFSENMAYPLLFLIIVGFFLLNDFEKLKRRAV